LNIPPGCPQLLDSEALMKNLLNAPPKPPVSEAPLPGPKTSELYVILVACCCRAKKCRRERLEVAGHEGGGRSHGITAWGELGHTSDWRKSSCWRIRESMLHPRNRDSD
jgi:hypothetical protein